MNERIEGATRSYFYFFAHTGGARPVYCGKCETTEEDIRKAFKSIEIRPNGEVHIF